MLRALNESILVSLSDWVILAFVLGLLVQEVLASCREGCFIYFSKWWNVVDTMIVVLFALAYAMWGISYAYFGRQWKPENNAFITADVLFSSGIIMAFFHLTHIFQVRAQIKGVCLLSFNSDGDLRLEKHPVCRENKTNCFPRDHTLSVQVSLGFYKNNLESL